VFITFEGIDGAGKTTQIERLQACLEALGLRVLVTREPGATGLGKEVRSIVLHSTDPIAPMAELFLYEADRAQHVATVIQPALADGTWVLCDRFTDSTVAYQGYGRGLDLEQLKDLNQLATQGLVPDKTIWLDGPVEELLARTKGRQKENDAEKHDRFESQQLSFFERLRQGYADLATAEPSRFVRLDALQTPEEIAEQLWHALLPLHSGLA